MPSIHRPSNYIQESGHCYEDDDTGSDCSCPACEGENDESEVILSELPTPIAFTCPWPTCGNRMIYGDGYWVCAVCMIERGNLVWASAEELVAYYRRAR